MDNVTEKDMKAVVSPFKERLEGKVVTVGDVQFTLRALPTTVLFAIQAKALESQILHVVRWGISACSDSQIEYEDETMLDETFKVMRWASVNKLKSQLLSKLYIEIDKLTTLEEGEMLKLDFT